MNILRPDCFTLLERAMDYLSTVIRSCGVDPACYARSRLDALTHPFSRASPRCSRWLRSTRDAAFSLRIDTLQAASLVEGDECRNGIPVVTYRLLGGEAYTLCIGGNGVTSGATLPCLTPMPHLEVNELSSRDVILAILTGYLSRFRSRSRSPLRPERLVRMILEDQLKAYSSRTLGGLNLRSPPPLRLLWLRAPIPLYTGPVLFTLISCPEDATVSLYHALARYTRAAVLEGLEAPVCRLMLLGKKLVAFAFQRREDRVYAEAIRRGCSIELLEMVTVVRLYRPRSPTSSARRQGALQARV